MQLKHNESLPTVAPPSLMDGTTTIILDSLSFSSPPPDVLNGSLCARGLGATFRQPVVDAFARILYPLELP